MRIARAAAAGLVALAAIAWPATPSTSARILNPCGLLTTAQVTSLLGTTIARVQPTVTRGRPASSPSFSVSCTWTGPPAGSGSSGPNMVLTLRPESRSSFVTASSREPGTARATGVGAIAYWRLNHHLLAAWSHGWTAELGAGMAGLHPERAKLDLASVLKQI